MQRHEILREGLDAATEEADAATKVDEADLEDGLEDVREREVGDIAIGLEYSELHVGHKRNQSWIAIYAYMTFSIIYGCLPANQSQNY